MSSPSDTNQIDRELLAKAAEVRAQYGRLSVFFREEVEKFHRQQRKNQLDEAQHRRHIQINSRLSRLSQKRTR